MSKSKKRPNIVLICVDQMRGDCPGSAELPIFDSVEGRLLLPHARGEDPGRRKYIHGEHTAGTNLSYHHITDGEIVPGRAVKPCLSVMTGEPLTT